MDNNYIDSCVEGIQIWQSSNNNTVTENTIINCQDHAIRFQYSNDNKVMRNNITRSGCGTSIYVSNNNTISNNNYVNNTFQFSANEDYYLTFGHNRSVNTISLNYWSDYNGSDTNNDGKGDTPYVIDEYNKDSYPLVMPYQISVTPEPTLESEPFPTVLVATASTATIALVSVGLLVYFKKRKH